MAFDKTNVPRLFQDLTNPRFRGLSERKSSDFHMITRIMTLRRLGTRWAGCIPGAGSSHLPDHFLDWLGLVTRQRYIDFGNCDFDAGAISTVQGGFLQPVDMAIPNIGKGNYLIDIKQDATRLNRRILVE